VGAIHLISSGTNKSRDLSEKLADSNFPTDKKSGPRTSELILHWKHIAASLILTLSSNFGQTFFIALAVPHFLKELGLSAGQFGLLYGTATLVSACCLPLFGRILDRSCPQRFTVFTLLGLSASALCLSMSYHVVWLFLAILGLRFTGQGLCSLIAATSIGRQFRFSRGKALSLAGLGYPIGEAALPILGLMAIEVWGWRLPWVGVAVLAGTVLPMALSRMISRRSSEELGDFDSAKSTNDSVQAHDTGGTPSKTGLRQDPLVSNETAVKESSGADDFHWLRDRAFLAMIPAILSLPAIMTALLVHQARLAEFRNWPLTLLATGLAVFAGTRIVSSLSIGPVIDKVGAMRMMPLTLGPVSVGLLLLAWMTRPAAILCFFALAGLSQGMSSSILTSAWAEIYGPKILGTVKGRVTMLAIFGSAIGPILMGWALDRNWTINLQLYLLCACSLFSMGLAFLSVRAYKKRRIQT
jgi:MFS family permease